MPAGFQPPGSVDFRIVPPTASSAEVGPSKTNAVLFSVGCTGAAVGVPTLLLVLVVPALGVLACSGF